MTTNQEYLKYFPRIDGKVPRASQRQVINAIEDAYEKGYKNVLLEAPVGSGKSAIAITVASYFGNAHILTPRKSLQNQYWDDFQKLGNIRLMKGRSSYPCYYYKHFPPKKGTPEYKIREKLLTLTCAEGPCLKDWHRYYSSCTAKAPCPYNLAIDLANSSEIIVHNFHSFIFQTNFAGRFFPRKLLIIDECHEIEGICRDFASKSFDIPHLYQDLSKLKEFDFDDWISWLTLQECYFSDTIPEDLEALSLISPREEYRNKVAAFSDMKYVFDKGFSNVIQEDYFKRSTKVIFTPVEISALVNNLILDKGKKTLLMSGTIYNKPYFCKTVGLKEEETCFIRIGSSFPVDNRPIYMKPKLMVDTSHKNWDTNFPVMIDKIQEVCEAYPDVKGLIHTPSYRASKEIYDYLKEEGRVLYHDKDDFLSTLEVFYKEKDPFILLSPVCQQGVDFKDDRARFQIILRVPYLNTSDNFVEYQAQNNFPWYNYQALVLFGQQIGRVVRSPEDYGDTILLDSRFPTFVSRNKGQLPKWLMDAIIK
jgi:Rad3-related DNA helicase